jgi:hypothetical protein
MPTYSARFNGGPKDGRVERFDMGALGPHERIVMTRTVPVPIEPPPEFSAAEIGTYHLKGKWGDAVSSVWVYEWQGWESYP